MSFGNYVDELIRKKDFIVYEVKSSYERIDLFG